MHELGRGETIVFSACDMSSKSWKFTARNNKTYICSGWKEYRDEKDLEVGDEIVFIYNNTPPSFYIGYRRKWKRIGNYTKRAERPILRAAEREIGQALESKRFQVLIYDAFKEPVMKKMTHAETMAFFNRP